MDAQQITSLLTNPALLHGISVEELEDVAAQYPYSAVLQTLLVKRYQLQGETDMDSALAKAALLHPNRQVLYHYMERPLQAPLAEAVPKPAERAVTTPVKEKVPAPTVVETIAPPVKTEPTATPEPVSAVANKEPEPATVTTPQDIPAPIQVDIEKDKLSFSEWLKRVREGAVQDAKDLEQIIQSGSYEAQLVKASAKAEEEKPAPRKEVAKEVPSQQPKDDGGQMNKQVDDLAQKSVTFDDELVTETLAKIFELQKKYSKALDAYERLLVKHPERKALYLAAIERLKTKQ